ncbi:MAG: hypothetical protein ABL907_23115 [Hyphomicrobium sp.]
MSSKSVPFRKPAPATVTPESWVDGNTTAPAMSAVAMSRLTLDLPVSLHRRIKMRCAESGDRMVERLREILEREFPA